MWLFQRIGRSHFLRRSIRYRFFELLKKDVQFEVAFYGLKWVGNLVNFVDRSVFFFGAHEREQLNFSKKFISNATVVDCGANTGNHSLFYSVFARRVISIEASDIRVSEIRERLARNDISNVIVLNCGVGSENNVLMPFYHATGDNQGVSSFLDEFAPGNSFTKHVNLRTLDSIVIELKIPKVDFIKIDVEGFDYEVLKGSRTIIERDSPVIQIEYHPRDLEKMMDFLSDFENYIPKSLIVNQPFFVLNWYRGKLLTFDPNLRCEVFLLPS
jgi:FkbM family methyltransferase